MKACVVDDDHTSLVLIGEFLEDQGWDVSLFNHPSAKSSDGSNLEDIVSQEDNKLLIMDVRFGRDKEGLKLGLQTVKNLIEQKKINLECMILFVSQFGQEDINFCTYENSLKGKGINCAWFDKPIDFVLLNSYISAISSIDRNIK